MKEKLSYDSPEMEVIFFSTQDIITSSTDDNVDHGGGDWNQDGNEW